MTWRQGQLIRLRCTVQQHQTFNSILCAHGVASRPLRSSFVHLPFRYFGHIKGFRCREGRRHLISRGPIPLISSAFGHFESNRHVMRQEVRLAGPVGRR